MRAWEARRERLFWGQAEHRADLGCGGSPPGQAATRRAGRLLPRGWGGGLAGEPPPRTLADGVNYAGAALGAIA
eukprot:6792320-Pyramimonas_sp.AAC.1